MKKYFTTEIQDVKINGELRKDVQVVVSEQMTTNSDGIGGLLEVPQEYYNANLIGLAYLPNEEVIFQQIDEEVQPLSEEVTLADLDAKLDYLVMMSE